MYCSKCGKQIPTGTICSECAAQTASNSNQQAQQPYQQPQQPQQAYYQPQQAYYQPQPTYQQAYQTYQQPVKPKQPQPQKKYAPENRMVGFPKALTSTILSNVGFIFVYIAMIVAAIEPGAGLFFTLLSLPLVIIPLIYGIESIKVFAASKNYTPKPIATLILGIAGLSMSALSAIFAFVSFIISVTLI